MKKKILIIDDELDLCILMRSYLTLKNYEVKIANTLAGGLTILAGFHPDILFLDNNLPDGSGWEQAGNIFKNYPLIKINLMSGEQPLHAKENLNLQLTILEKPLSLTNIDQAIITA